MKDLAGVHTNAWRSHDVGGKRQKAQGLRLESWEARRLGGVKARILEVRTSDYGLNSELFYCPCKYKR